MEATKENNISSIEVLLDQCFGLDRHKKTAYRLREGVPSIDELSFVVRIDKQIKASLQFWPILINDSNRSFEALLLGPIAVSEDCRGQGLGLELMNHGLKMAKKLGHKRVLLVGDEAYYKKVGFSRLLAKDLSMPGPVDEDRLLAQELIPGAMKSVKGMISKASQKQKSV